MLKHKWFYLILFSLSGCVNYSGIHHKQYIASPSQFKTQKSLTAKGGQWPTLNWTQQFGDPQLSALVNQAMLYNFDIKTAEARLTQARAVVDGKNAALLPQINFLALVSRYKAPIPLGNGWQTMGLSALNFDYEIDFWGKNYSSLTQALSQEKVSQASLYEIQLMIATMIASAYSDLDYEYALVDLLRKTVIQRKSLDKITQVRVTSGLGTKVELYQSKNLYATAQTQLVAAEGQIIITRQQLGTLLGLGPDQGFQIKRPRLNRSPIPKLPDNLPLNLLGRRPDVVAARWQIEAALSGVKHVKARFYPDVNLLAVAGFLSFDLNRLFRTSNELIAATPAVRLPVFDAGVLRAQLKGQYGILDEQISIYNATLNKALGDIAQQLSSIKSIEKQLLVQQNALFTAKQAYDVSIQQYQIGLNSQIVVLDAQTRYLEEQRSHLLLIKSRRELQISLIKALGGGFNEHMLTTPRTTATPNYILKKDVHG
ncbi:MAG: efflux transporter outer membrane subunit [bacterium]|nr:efflux transporter outer membrane subunit [bacterium]